MSLSVFLYPAPEKIASDAKVNGSGKDKILALLGMTNRAQCHFERKREIFPPKHFAVRNRESLITISSQDSVGAS
jgi:hypothetical protein